MNSSLPGRFSLRRFLTFSGALVLSLSLGLPAAHARDLRVIRDARTPVAYEFELEPHMVVGTDPPGPGVGSGVGLGIRGSLVILPDGFIRNVNDSVAIGAGFDIGHYYGGRDNYGYRDDCVHFENGPAGTQVCTDVTSYGGTYNYVYVPVVMQWNFWLTQRWSVFGEPGLNIYVLTHHAFNITPAAYAGGRFVIANGITVTARLGYPTFSLGLSFML
jgi:hypothetical protein